MNFHEFIDLGAERNKREQPDPQFVRKDEYGRPLYCFLLSYDFDGGRWSTEVWAYSAEEAAARVEAMRKSLKYDGQLYERIPL